MNDETNIQTLLERLGAIITESHIVYTSGRHGHTYINKDALYPYPNETSAVCERLAAAYADAQIDVVAGPTIGGVILSQWVAYHLQQRSGREVFAVYAEEEGSGNERRRLFRRGYDQLITGRRVLVVEDILNTGGSAQRVVAAVREAKGEVVGVGALCNRGMLNAATLDVPELVALLTISLESWDAHDCPLCRAGVPINTHVGKGRS